MAGGRTRKARASALLGLAALVSVALVGCGPFPFGSVPQQNCVAQRQGTLGPVGGVILPLAARDPTDTAHKVSALYAINGSDGSLAWSCASTTFYGWDDVQMAGGVVYALAGTEDTKEGEVTRAHAIYAIRPSDGKQLWSYSFMAGATSRLAFGGGLIFTTTETGAVSGGPPGHHPGGAPPKAQWELLAVRADSGALAWSVTLDSAPEQPVAIAGRVVVPLNNGGNEWSLRTYNGATGAVAWSYELSRGAADFIALDARDGALYAEIDHSLIALDGASGAPRWTRMIQPSLIGVNSEPGQARLTANAIIVPLDQGLAAYSLASGAPLWSTPLGQQPVVVIGPDQRVYALTLSPSDSPGGFVALVALDAATGKTLWKQDVSKVQSLNFTPGPGGDVYLTEPTRAKLDESVIALNSGGGARWRFDGQSPYNAGDILTSGDHLYYIWQAPNGVDGLNQADITYVTCLSASDGSTHWQMALPGVNGDPVEPLLAS